MTTARRLDPTEGLPKVLNDKYRLDRRVGEGTYGVVYSATELATNTRVAIKEMRPDDAEEGFPSSALREIALLLELQHDNVVRLREVARDSRAVASGGAGATQLFLVFDYLDLDLHKLMEANPHLSHNPRLIKYYTWQMLCGLEFLHRRRVLHRDLKPQNLLIDARRNRVKLADFGLSRAYGVPLRLLSPEVVTLWYRPPELLLGGKVYSTPVDVWSLGCIIIEMSNRWPLFPGQSEMDELAKIFQVLGTPDEAAWPGVRELPHWRSTFPRWPAKPWEQIAPRLDALGRDLVAKMLTYDPMQRISAPAALRHPYFNDIHDLLRAPPAIDERVRA